MINCYKCEKCGQVFEDSAKAWEHECAHFTPKNWWDENDMKVVNRETEWEPGLYAPSAVVVPMERTICCEGTWKTEVSYVKYYYSAKKPSEQVFPIDDSIMG